MYTFTPEMKRKVFLACADKNYADVGFEFGLDKHYAKVKGMKDAVARVFTQVKNDPIFYEITMEVANDVAKKVEERKTAGLVPFQPGHTTRSLKETIEIEQSDIKGLMLGARNKAAKIIHEKLNRIEKSKKAIDDIGLGELAKVVGILFDKGQIIQGQSTENIAVMSKNITDNMSPEDALNHVLGMRENVIAEKNQ